MEQGLQCGKEAVPAHLLVDTQEGWVWHKQQYTNIHTNKLITDTHNYTFILTHSLIASLSTHSH